MENLPPQNAKRQAARFRLLGALLCLAAGAFNLQQPWAAFSANPLSDPASYPDLARASSWFFDSGIREPLPVFLTKLGLLSGLSPDLAVRLPAMALALISGPALCALAWPVLGGPASYAAGLLLAFNPWLGFYAACGSNSVHAGFFLSIFLLLLMSEGGLKTALFAGIAAGLAALSLLESAGIAAACCLLYATLDGAEPKKAFPYFTAAFNAASWRRAGLALAVCVALACPWLVWQKAHFGSFTHSHGLHARFWLNASRGVPPGPERYMPGPASPSAPLLREGVMRAPVLIAKGYAAALKRAPGLLRSKAVFAAAICGGICAFFMGAPLLPLALAAAIFPVAPILTLDQAGPGMGVEMRFLLHTLWLWCLCAGFAVKAAFTLYEKRTQNVSAKKFLAIGALCLLFCAGGASAQPQISITAVRTVRTVPAQKAKAAKTGVWETPRPQIIERDGQKYEVFSMRPNMERSGITLRDQGNRGTCAIFAITLALEYEWTRRNFGKAVQLSPAYLFWAAQKRNFRNDDDGSALEQVVMGAKRYGICTEKLFPYDTATAGQAPPSGADWDASKRAVFTAYWIKKQSRHSASSEDDNTAALMQALKRNHPVVAGLFSDTAGQDAHALTVVGYVKPLGAPGKIMLGLADSASAEFGYMRLEDFSRRMFEAVYFQY
ncbi:MAG: C1 family peptidase [Elusimicrobia bacterium]|nr:C1 family peptidase [Elusimicrobiota bacterium]